mgnify:CR=1 FL=1
MRGRRGAGDQRLDAAEARGHVRELTGVREAEAALEIGVQLEGDEGVSVIDGERFAVDNAIGIARQQGNFAGVNRAHVLQSQLARDLLLVGQRLDEAHPGDRENSLYASLELSLRRLPEALRVGRRRLGGRTEVTHEIHWSSIGRSP